MDTNVLTPREIFLMPQHLVIPLFQRPYVWDETEQWLPLWLDVKRMAEFRLADPYTSATHFLGAVVFQHAGFARGTLLTKNVIDGQQRLTTLQLLADATAAAVSTIGADLLAQQLGDLTHNHSNYVKDRAEILKLRHTNRDGAAFAEVMDADPPIAYDSLTHAAARITRAHEFFAERVTEWLAAGEDTQRRAETLTHVITQGLQLVVIDLMAGENSQEIFETLNARGTPLTAADLVKNFVFQKLEAEGVDTRKAYAEDWPFETKFWEAEESVGRNLMSRSSIFISQWLASRVGEEVSPRQTFSRFKHYVDHEARTKMGDLLVAIKSQAAMYETWTLNSLEPDKRLTVAETAFYRMKTSEMELLKPAIIWLHEPGLGIPTPVAEQVIAMLESWVVRRQLLGLSNSDLGRVVAEIVREHRGADATNLIDRVQTHLTRQNALSTYWPGDDEIRRTMATLPAYPRIRRSRLRMLLEAVEDHYRAATAQPRVHRADHHIEHVLPQSFQANWPVEDPEAEAERAEHVHRLGNLTLLTGRLNMQVSNSAWHIKRAELVKHDTYLLNRTFRDRDSWDEAAIDARTQDMVQALLATWPVPEGHTGVIAQASTKEIAWVELKHLIAADLLAPGTVLQPRSQQYAGATATVTPDGRLDVDGELLWSPSGASKKVIGGYTVNGWNFWLLPDGRPIDDLRNQLRGTGKPSKQTRFDWSQLHAILEALPAGRWTSYTELANAIGTASQPLGNHLIRCPQCANTWRVLTADGMIAEAFAWAEADGKPDPRDLLVEEGIDFTTGRANRDQMLTSDDLIGLGTPSG